MQLLHSGIAIIAIVRAQKDIRKVSSETATYGLLEKEIKMAYASHSNALSSGLMARSVALLSAASDYMDRRRAYRSTFNELSRLSNHELADLGLNRSMIRSVALEAAQKV